MFLSWLQPRRKTHKRPASFRPSLEPLEDRFVPTSPHFISATSGINSAGALTVSFKEAGLGANQNIDYKVTGNEDATFGFQNKGGNTVNGTPFHATGAALAQGSFNSGKNGNVVGTLVSDVPTPQPSDFKPINGSGWKLVTNVSYTNVVLTDTTNNLSIGVADQSATIITPLPKQ